MPGTSTIELTSISYDLQRIALVLVIIGFVAMRMRLGKLNRYKFKTHDIILTFAYLLVILSLPRMINFAYFSIISHRISPLVLVHSLVGIVVLAIGFIFVINRGSLKIKKKWKNKRNMQILTVLWIINFISGAYILASLFHR
jgi:hypothetical protein